jgi:hypothetical protein
VTQQERIIRNALDAVIAGQISWGEGGSAAAKVYKEGQLDPETMLFMIAVMANGLTALEQPA